MRKLNDGIFYKRKGEIKYNIIHYIYETF